MRPSLSFISLICFIFISCSNAQAQFSTQTAYEFLEAQTAVYKNGSSNNIEKFVAFMTEDVKDFHVAYDREFSGKDFFRKNMPNKAKALISYEKQISQVILGTNVAVVIYHEQSKEKKRDGRIKSYDGRTLMVIEFNDDGLITQMRRYQD